MKFSDFVSISAIKAELGALDKPGAIRELVESLAAAGSIKQADAEGIVAAIMKREELGSTGIGRGVAVPHTKHASVDRLVGTVGVSSEGVDFNSLDGDKVQLFFLLVSPPIALATTCGPWKTSRGNCGMNVLPVPEASQDGDDIQLLLEEADNNQFVA